MTVEHAQSTQLSKEEKAKKVVISLIVVSTLLFLGGVTWLVYGFNSTATSSKGQSSNLTLIQSSSLATPSLTEMSGSSEGVLDRLKQLKKEGGSSMVKDGMTTHSVVGSDTSEHKSESEEVELDLNSYISDNPFDSQRHLDESGLIDFGQRFQATLLKTIDTQGNDGVVLAELTQTPFGRVTITGTYSVSQKNKKIYIQFSKMYGENNLTMSINAVAYSMNGDPGIEAEFNSSSKNDVLKTVLVGVKDIAVSAVSGVSSHGAAVVNTAASSPINSIDTQVSMHVAEHTRFLVVFNDRVIL